MFDIPKRGFEVFKVLLRGARNLSLSVLYEIDFEEQQGLAIFFLIQIGLEKAKYWSRILFFRSMNFSCLDRDQAGKARGLRLSGEWV